MASSRKKKEASIAETVQSIENRQKRAIELLAACRSNDEGFDLIRAAQPPIAAGAEVLKWLKDPDFVSRVTELREERLGDLAVSVRNVAKSYAVDAMNELVAIALGKKRGLRHQLPAIVELLDRAGIDPKATPKRRDLFVLIRQRILEQAPAPGQEVAVVESETVEAEAP